MWAPFMKDITVDYNEGCEESEVQECVDKINGLIKRVQSSGGNIKALGKYLELEDVLQVELSSKTIN